MPAPVAPVAAGVNEGVLKLDQVRPCSRSWDREVSCGDGVGSGVGDGFPPGQPPEHLDSIVGTMPPATGVELIIAEFTIAFAVLQTETRLTANGQYD